MAATKYDAELLRRLRNEIRIDALIQRLGWPAKTRQGHFEFVCPCCGERQSDVKRDTNLGRCFHCKTNFNPIDFTMWAHACDFVEAVEFLIPLLPR